MITPVNRHLLIEPLKRESFIADNRETYQEKGTVIAFDNAINDPVPPLLQMDREGEITRVFEPPFAIQQGDIVLFDAWLAAKYPKNENEYYWLVKWEDVRAVERYEEVPE